MLVLLFLQDVSLIVETCFDEILAWGLVVIGNCVIGVLSCLVHYLMHGILSFHLYSYLHHLFAPNSLLFLLDIMSSFRMIKDLGKAFMPSTMSFYSYFACDGNSTCMLYPLSIKLMYPYLAESSLSEASEVHFKWKT